ncbi:MAG: hypothetical protein AAFV53_15250 [Myxococcota bacterium]
MIVKELERNLSKLRVGHRAWFWWCAEADPPLLLSSLRADPGAEKLKAQRDRIAPSPGALQSSGIASVGPDGALTLGGAGLTAASLWQLASWARPLLATHPELAMLRGTRMVEIEGGYVIATHQDDALWEGFPEVVRPGSPQQTVERLDKLPPDRDAWFWATDAGPGHQPTLLLGSAWRDRDGSHFARQVVELRRQSPALGAQLRGILRKRKDDAVVFTAAQDVNHSLQILLPLLETPLGEALRGATVAELRDGVLRAAAPLVHEEGPNDAPSDASAQEQLLARFDHGDRLSFWFTAADNADRPLLLLAERMSDLKPLVSAHRGSGRSVRGIVERTRRGWLHFQVKQPYPDFIVMLADWTARHIGRHPGLSALIGARLTQSASITIKSG